MRRSGLETVSRFDESRTEWIVSSKVKPHLQAVVRAGRETLLLGVKVWDVYNDSQHCSHGPNYSTNISFSSCTDQQFTCAADGSCVAMELRYCLSLASLTSHCPVQV